MAKVQKQHPTGKGGKRQPTGKSRGQRKKADGSSERAVVGSLKALQLKCSGASYQMIAEQLKVSKGTAFNYVNNALDLMVQEDGKDFDKWRRLENERLDMLWMKVFPNVVNATPDARGMIKVTDDLMKSLSICLQISRRRAKMNGLDIAWDDRGQTDDGQSPELKQVINIFNVIREKDPQALDAALEVYQAPANENGVSKALPKKKPKNQK